MEKMENGKNLFGKFEFIIQIFFVGYTKITLTSLYRSDRLSSSLVTWDQIQGMREKN